ncbi:MAG: universal stress protein, partial [Pedococcus sp.]
GCDGSWESLDAVETAVREALWREQPLVVLTVADKPGQQVRQLGDWARSSAEGERDAQSVGRRALDRVGDRVPAVTAVTASSAQAPELEDLAARASLLVVGRHGSHGLGAFALGSTSEQLVRRLGCPVIVAGASTGPRTGRDERSAGPHPVVVVGIDDDPSAHVVLAIAVEAAQARGWALTVVYAAGRTDTELHLLAARIWDRHAGLLLSQRAPDHSLARVVVDVDDAVPALLAHAGPRDLLVVGTQGQGRLAGLISGSVARGVLDQMPCDVLVVPPAVVTARGLVPVVAGSTGLAPSVDS